MNFNFSLCVFSAVSTLEKFIQGVEWSLCEWSSSVLRVDSGSLNSLAPAADKTLR